MAFNVLLATSPAIVTESVHLLPRLRFAFLPFGDGKFLPFKEIFEVDPKKLPPYPESVVAFPAPGSTIQVLLEFPSSFPMAFLYSKFEAKEIDTDVGFSVGPVFDEETLTLVATSGYEFVGTVSHGPKFYAAKQNCIARCPNGDESQNCVTCRTSKHSVRVCC